MKFTSPSELATFWCDEVEKNEEKQHLMYFFSIDLCTLGAWLGLSIWCHWWNILLILIFEKKQLNKQTCPYLLSQLWLSNKFNSKTVDCFNFPFTALFAHNAGLCYFAEIRWRFSVIFSKGTSCLWDYNIWQRPECVFNRRCYNYVEFCKSSC